MVTKAGTETGRYAPERVEKVVERWPVPHPIPYQGSKRALAPIILSYFPSKIKRLVEPFAGSAAISLATAYKGLTTTFLINDAHKPLAALWSQIVLRPEELASQYEELWQQQAGKEKEFYNAIRKRFNESHEPACFLYLLARCVKAAIRYNGAGEFNNSPDNRRRGANPASMRSRIVGASNLLGNEVKITSQDYLHILQGTRKGDLIYLDPPYQGVCGNRDNRYAPKVEHGEFCDALASLNKKDSFFVVSYDGRMGDKVYGEPMPSHLNLYHIEIHAGRSSQATLLGRDSDTFESLYLSPALAEAIAETLKGKPRTEMKQRLLFD